MTDLVDNVDSPSTEQCEALDLWCNVEKFARDLLQDVVEIAQDVAAWVFDQLLSVVLLIVGSIPAPDVAPIDWSGLGPVLYFAGQLQIDVALGILGAGLAFRLARKFLTLFQW